MARRLADIRQCAKDMEYFLSIGWKKSDLDTLEKLWWKTLPARRRAWKKRPAPATLPDKETT